MKNIDSKVFLQSVGNDLKIAIDDVIEVIQIIQEDVEKLKTKTSKPDKHAATALLEYIAMEDCQAKKNMEALYNKDIKQYFKWIDTYCDEHGHTQEQVLTLIIKGEI